MKTTPSRALLIATLCLLTAALPACRKKRQAEEEQQQAAAMADPFAALQDQLPADVSAALLIRDWQTALHSYGPLRDRLQRYLGDLRTVEADLRNTLGIDPRRPERLAEIGVSPEAGGAVAIVAGHPIIILGMGNEARFRDHLVQVLQGQPFNLRAPVTQRDHNGATVLEFAAAEGQPPRYVAAFRDGWAHLARGDEDTRWEPVVEALTTTAQPTLRAHEPSQRALAQLEDKPLLVVGQGTELLGMLVPAFRPMINAFASDVGTLVFGFTLHTDRLRGELVGVPLPGRQDAIARVLTREPDTTAPDFRALLHNDAYAFARIQINATQIVALLRQTVDAFDDNDGAVASTRASLDELVGMSLENELIPAMGHDAFVMATRARMITLMGISRSGNVSPGALGEGFGLAGAVAIRDRDTVLRALVALAAASPGTIVHEPAPPLDLFRLRGANERLGTFVLHEQFLILVPERQRDELLAGLTTGEAPAIPDINAAAAVELIGATDDSGIFLDLKRIANGSIGQLLGGQLPDGMRTAIQVFEEAWARLRWSDDLLRGDFEVTLATPAD